MKWDTHVKCMAYSSHKINGGFHGNLHTLFFCKKIFFLYFSWILVCSFFLLLLPCFVLYQCLLGCIVSDVKACINTLFPCMWWIILLLLLSKFLSVFGFQPFYYDISRCLSLCVCPTRVSWESWIHKLIFVIKFGEF